MACKEGATKCIGPNLYVCVSYYDPPTGTYTTRWELARRDAPECAEPEPEPEPPPDDEEPEPEPPPDDEEPEPPAVVPCEITITAPSSAEEGETVNASVRIKNVSPYHYSYKATISAVPDLYPDYVIGEIDQVITSGSSVTEDVPFTMPDCKVTVFVWVERWSFDEWVYDSSGSKVISLEVPATYHLDIHVPSWAAGGYVEPGSGDYPANETVILTAHPLSGYQFTGWGGDASGTSLTYDLYMNSDKYVEAYFEKVPVPEYEGTIITKELEYDETRSNIPVY